MQGWLAGIQMEHNEVQLGLMQSINQHFIIPPLLWLILLESSENALVGPDCFFIWTAHVNCLALLWTQPLYTRRLIWYCFL